MAVRKDHPVRKQIDHRLIVRLQLFSITCMALLKGLEVRIITPGLNDNWFVRQASNDGSDTLKLATIQA